jgi:hypothetical protein
MEGKRDNKVGKNTTRWNIPRQKSKREGHLFATPTTTSIIS